MGLQALQESPAQIRDQVGLLIEAEVAGVEDMHLGAWHVPAVRLGLLDLERRVLAAPYNLQRRLVLAEPVLPGGVAGDVGAVVVEQVGLDVLLAGPAEEGELITPQVRAVILRVRAGPTCHGRVAAKEKKFSRSAASWVSRSAQNSRRSFTAGRARPRGRRRCAR